jgi:hypothetical protein
MLLGRMILFREEQLENALSLILVMLLGRMILFREEQI